MKTIFYIFILAICLSTFAETKRNPAQRAAFVRANPCPLQERSDPNLWSYRSACPGYVVDHIKALACGGADHPSNMQWQTVAEGKAKDKWERKECQ